jgi:4-amino-4-deoxy-L-arabinose transferase-like glycosyltransferase
MADLTPAQFLIAFAIAATAGTLVFFHAERHRIRHPSAWAGFVFLFLIVGLPAYLLHVRRIRRARA